MEPLAAPYMAVYSAPLISLDAPVVVNEADIGLTFRPGPWSFTYSVPMKSLGPGHASMMLGERKIQLPSGSYVVIEAEADPRARSERERVALRIAEVASLITLRHPHLLDEKIFEGVINVPGRFLVWSDGPIRLTAAPAVDPSDVISGFRNSIAAVQELDTETQYRFQLASRWFRRGHEVTNEVDRFLFGGRCLKSTLERREPR